MPVQVRDRHGIARWIWMDRRERSNALNPALIASLRKALEDARSDSVVRVVVLAGRGKAFCAGADVNWMRASVNQPRDDNIADARQLAGLLRDIADLGKPVISRIHGPAVGGGVGLAAAADLAIATPDAWFRLSEVRLGLVPAMISPYLAAVMGPRQSLRMALTGDRIDAKEAMQLGLVSEVVEEDRLDRRIADLVLQIALGGPLAISETKKLFAEVARRPLDDELVETTAGCIADIRSGDEGQEGMTAFLERRPPAWMR